MSGDSHARPEPVRLNKLLAGMGVGSRRHCDRLIAEGRVSVDGARAAGLGAKALPGARIEVDGRPVNAGGLSPCGGAPHTYVLLYKPLGVISSADDQFGRKTVVDLVAGGINKRVFPVGRLDYNSAGLILLTDDGGYAYRATHPKFGVQKTYEVVCDRPPDGPALERLRSGVALDDGYMTAPAGVSRDAKNPALLRITLREGRNRQIRRMLEACGYGVKALTRVAIGGLGAKGLAPGGWRALNEAEANLIFQERSHIIDSGVCSRAKRNEA